MELLNEFVFASKKYTNNERKWKEYKSFENIEYLYFCKKQITKKCILYFHGNGINIYDIDDKIKTIGERISILCVEYPGFGKDSNNRTASIDLIQKEYFNNVKKIINLEKINEENIIIMGHSLGTSIALCYSNIFKSKELILISAYTNIKNIIYEKINMEIKYSPEFFENIKNINTVKSDKLYIVHGNKDDLVCEHHAFELEKKSKIPTKIIIISDMGHNINWEKVYTFLILPYLILC